jgi:fatty-acyl-CoA synthase
VDIGWITRAFQNAGPSGNSSRRAVTFEDGRSWSYQDLHQISNRYANALAKFGVEPGARVGIVMQNSLEYVALYLAITKLGAIAVRINFRLVTEELDYILRDSSPVVLCLDHSMVDKIAPLASSLPIQHFFVLAPSNAPRPSWAESWQILDQGSESDLDYRPNEPDPAMLMYTSGTTGRPKGALWTQGNLLWFSAIQVMRWQLSGDTVSLMTGPMYHVGAMEDIGLPTLMMGGQVVILRSGQFDIGRVLSMIKRHHVTDAILFPFMIYDLLQIENLHPDDLVPLRHIYSGGDPLLPWAIERLQTHFPHIKLTQVYGLTEGTPIVTSLDSPYDIGHADSVGTPLPLCEVRVAGDDSQQLQAGETGEIWSRSPVIAREYWNNPKATEETFQDGWCHTGDLGTMDKDGLLHVVGRKKDMIRSGGENIYPVEIEDVLMRHPAIREAAVIGVPDSQYLEIVCAVVVLRESTSLSEEEVIAYCREHLAGYKRPRRVKFVPELPRTPSGKVTKHVLRSHWSIT